MLRSLSFTSERNSTYSSRSRSSTPIQRIWRYLSTSELTGYRSELSLPVSQAVDDGHPLGLGNPNVCPIIRHILHHLEAPDLLSLRRVSLRWNHIACENLRRKLNPVAIRPSKIKQFLRLMKRCFSNPFGSYAIRIENLRDLHLKNFFKRFSLDIIKLRVKINSDELPEFFNRLLQGLPNLEALHLIRIPEGILNVRADYVNIPSAWVYGVFHFPKMKSIIFESDEPYLSFQRNYDAILSQVVNSAPNLVRIGFVGWDSHFSRVISRCGISNPKSFDGWQFANSNPKLKQDLLELFYDHRMKFKALKFWIDDKKGDGDTSSSSLTFELVMDLTLQTGESLYHLALRNDDESHGFQCSLKLRRLLTLNLGGWRGPVHFPGLAEQLPNLKSLKLNPSNFSGMDLSNSPEIELPTVESLTVMPLDGTKSNPVDAGLMEKLVTMCPCVTELYVQVDGNEPLHVVYRHWSRLTKLWVDIRGQGSDEGFTGIDPELVKVVGTPGVEEECGCSQLIFPPDKRRSSHIGKLTELRHLIIRAGCLSEATLTLGISLLERLQVLWLLPSFHVRVQEVNNNSDNNSMEDEVQEEFQFHHMPKPWCLRAIGDNFKHLRELVTSTEVVYGEEDVKYLRDKLPELEHRFEI